MDHLDLFSKVLVGWQVGITSIRVDVVSEGDVFLGGPVGPGAEVDVQESLVPTIEGTFITCTLHQTVEGL